jgi:hypothetical protein
MTSGPSDEEGRGDERRPGGREAGKADDSGPPGSGPGGHEAAAAHRRGKDRRRGRSDLEQFGHFTGGVPSDVAAFTSDT